MPLRKILLADADSDFRGILCHYLGFLNYPSPIQAGDGEEALSKAIIERPDLIIMEVFLPKTNGFQVVNHLRTNLSTRDMSILAATTLTLPGDPERCLKSGFNGYLAKPFTIRELGNLIQTLFPGDAKTNCCAQPSKSTT